MAKGELGGYSAASNQGPWGYRGSRSPARDTPPHDLLTGTRQRDCFDLRSAQVDAMRMEAGRAYLLRACRWRLGFGRSVACRGARRASRSRRRNVPGPTPCIRANALLNATGLA